MTYEKTTWVDGDVITAEKLNHIEDGIANIEDGSNVEIITFSLSDASPVSPGTDESIADVSGLFQKSINLSSPIQKSKIRAVWFEQMGWFTGSIEYFNGSGDDIYQISVVVKAVRKAGLSLSTAKLCICLEK